jgi:hypothetical protein
MIIVFTVAVAIAATIAVVQSLELKKERIALSEKDGIISALQTHVANLETDIAKLNSRFVDAVKEAPVVKEAEITATMAPAKPKKRYYKKKKPAATA